MADAAAFFNKKKKKKAFKFNANKIDAATVTKTVHVDAPALSNEQDVSELALSAGAVGAAVSPTAEASTATANTDQWDDANAAARKAATTAAAAAKDTVLDMKALDLKGFSEQDDIAEKLRVEETKAKLAAAKAGMEAEAQRLKDEKEKKDAGGGNSTSNTSSGKIHPRFGAAAAGMSGSGKWVPSHMRGGMMGSRPGGNFQQKIDTDNQELFPDLASADALLAKKKEEDASAQTYKTAKKTPVGGGATWGSRPKLNLKSRVGNETSSTPENPPPTQPTAAPELPKQTLTEAAPAPSVAPVPTSAVVKAPIKPKKKKKKDLSTFKPAS